VDWRAGVVAANGASRRPTGGRRRIWARRAAPAGTTVLTGC